MRNSKKLYVELCKWNKIIKFVLSVKLWEEIGFLQDPQKAYIFYAIRFVYISQKKSRNKLCLEPHETYILFRTFFPHVNIKWFYFYRPIPLSQSVKYLCISYMVNIMTGNDVLHSVLACGIQTLFWIIIIFIVFFDFSFCQFIVIYSI